jgi:predicted TIM-barrel fold metal-dependent hydrolase
MNHESRRLFLRKATAAALALPVELSVSAGVDTELAANTIIDTHVHFYDPTRPEGVPWPGKNDKLLYRPFLPKHFRELTRPQMVTGTVVVECSTRLEDNQWVLDQAKDEPFVVGLVGNLTPGADDFPKHLHRFARNPLFRGIRVVHEPLEKGLDQDRFIDDLKRLAKHDLELDVNGGPRLLPVAARLAQRIPELRIVIDHAANVPVDGKAPSPDWLAGIRLAAKQPNVFCKVSALVEGTRRRNGDAPTETAFYKPVLDALWAAFGEDRLIYGSNWPVSQYCASYATVLQIVREYFQAKGQSAAEQFFWRNALAAYKWVKR